MLTQGYKAIERSFSDAEEERLFGGNELDTLNGGLDEHMV